MKKILFLILPLLLFCLTSVAQDSIQIRKNTLNDQMIEAFDKSNSYQEYKVVKKTQLATLKRNILDSVSTLEKKIISQDSELVQQKNQIDSLRENLENTKQNLANSKEKEDGIAVFGILTSKATYNSIMWGIILVLLLVSGFLFYRFLNSHKITNAAQLKMAELEIELEDYRRNSLEREQKLRRKLQDEVNKNRKG
ncbi:tRNA (guanine-N1)-methyltransferase [Aequorivita sp. SDUM287046]|uniref:tRNA (Guanine-N1)-methyltransferase n=1 Tax=Aequorivita aurantiaca TaxID=3053356 RepID=A0ABT8DFV2_9FLAO|nr:tRNA (guanine-N1)-methyltransferase [Aequorivita aurantiaca]MDN3723778.1 tRNA (guanine-N1)-methyltransferase [Aequorivita aurantiaca]